MGESRRLVKQSSLNLSFATGTRLQRIAWAIALVALIVYSDSAPSVPKQILRQQFVWTTGVIGIFLIQLRRTLLRFRQAMIGLLLLVIHLFGMYIERALFPFKSGLTIIVGIAAETMILTLVYLRLGQTVDPEGPFGPTPEEKKTRSIPPLT
jgi:hypothetical protein